MIFSGYWVIQGFFNYGFWMESGPAGGFLPVTIGSMTFILASIGLFKDTYPTKNINKKNFLPVIGAFIMVFAVQVFGMIVSSGLFIIIWLLFIEKFKLLKASVLGISTIAVIYIVFDIVLKIPFPQGMIGV